jgi:hypothetical protein
MSLATKGLWFLGGAGIALGLSMSLVAFAWTSPPASPPSNNVSAPLNVGTSAQTKNGDLVVNGFSATVLCLPGSSPTGGCRSTWPGSEVGAPVGGSGTANYLPKFTSSNTLANSAITENGSDVGITSRRLNVTGRSGEWAIVGTGDYGVFGGGNVYGANFEGYGDYGVYVRNHWNGSGYTAVQIAYANYALYSASTVLAGAFVYYSDERLKKNIESIANSDALQKVLALNPVTYNWKDESKGTQTESGFIAQEVEKVLPEVVKTESFGEGLKTLDYARLTPVLVGAIKEQQKQIDELKAEVEALKAK